MQAAQLEKGGADRLRARCAELEERWAGALGRADAAAEEARQMAERLRETDMALQVTSPEERHGMTWPEERYGPAGHATGTLARRET